MTETGGNPNLLWDPAGDGSLVVIDHNLAFDPDFSATDFARLHVFADEIPDLFSDFLSRQYYATRFAAALHIWQQACSSIPGSWHYVDPECTIPACFPFAQVLEHLRRGLEDDFWVLPP